MPQITFGGRDHSRVSNFIPISYFPQWRRLAPHPKEFLHPKTFASYLSLSYNFFYSYFHILKLFFNCISCTDTGVLVHFQKTQLHPKDRQGLFTTLIKVTRNKIKQIMDENRNKKEKSFHTWMKIIQTWWKPSKIK